MEKIIDCFFKTNYDPRNSMNQVIAWLEHELSILDRLENADESRKSYLLSKMRSRVEETEAETVVVKRLAKYFNSERMSQFLSKCEKIESLITEIKKRINRFFKVEAVFYPKISVSQMLRYDMFQEFGGIQDVLVMTDHFTPPPKARPVLQRVP